VGAKEGFPVADFFSWGTSKPGIKIGGRKKEWQEKGRKGKGYVPKNTGVVKKKERIHGTRYKSTAEKARMRDRKVARKSDR